MAGSGRRRSGRAACRSTQANTEYRKTIAMLVDRVNTVTGQAYCDDATIMAWQLANEPRPGNNAANAGGPFAGDDYMGDPPHEPQGLYGVFDTDRTTLEVIRKFADKMRKTGAP